MLLKENSDLGISLVCSVTIVRDLVMSLLCPKKVCNYCKKAGHVIKCPIRPPRKSGADYVAAITLASSSATPTATTQVSASPGPTQNSVTPEMIQQMVNSALFALGVSGKPPTTRSPWLLDSGASNHMTHDP